MKCKGIGKAKGCGKEMEREELPNGTVWYTCYNSDCTWRGVPFVKKWGKEKW